MLSAEGEGKYFYFFLNLIAQRDIAKMLVAWIFLLEGEHKPQRTL